MGKTPSYFFCVIKKIWFAWYSEKQRNLVGFARYLDKSGEEIDVTEVNQNPEHIPTFNDSVRLGRVTHFCGVKARNHNKNSKYNTDLIYGSGIMKYDTSGPISNPMLITN